MLAAPENRRETTSSKQEDAPTTTPAADMWSLGAILLYIFTGEVVAHGMTGSSDNCRGRGTVPTQPLEGADQQGELNSILKASEVPRR